MKAETLQAFIDKLDGMIAALGQDVVFGRTAKEREAYELLKDARLKIIEELEGRRTRRPPKEL